MYIEAHDVMAKKRGATKILRATWYILSITALFTFMFTPTYANAGEVKHTWSSFLKFYTGIITGFLIHEGGHALVAELTDTDMDWRWGNINQPFEFTDHSSSDAKGAAINSAGLLFQATGAEVILQSDKIDKNDAFVRGMMTWNIVNPIMYSLDYWFIHETNKKEGNAYRGDLQGIEHYTSKQTAHGFALGITAIAVSQGYRFLKTQSWAPDWLKGKSNSHGVSVSPLKSGGFLLAFKISF